MLRVPFAEMKRVFRGILLRYGFAADRADQCAQLFAENSLDGVYSHGVNRFQKFIEQIKKGYIDAQAFPEKVMSANAFEQWNGNLGPGPLNAMFCTDRVVELAETHSIGCVALANTNHWMRGGAYGWRAARAGFAFIAWTNTLPNLPAWGAKDCHLGNNPLVMAVPRSNSGVVLDMAMSQFSYGKMEMFARKKEDLPVPGGFDMKGRITKDAGEILDSWRPLPIGYWKGAGLSLLLDLMAAVLTGGLATFQIGALGDEYNVSQIFMAFDISKCSHAESIMRIVDNLLDDYKKSTPVSDTADIVFPGERVLRIRRENEQKGIPVDPTIWQNISRL